MASQATGMRVNPSEFGFGTRCIHAGQQPDPTTGAIMTPIYQTSTYVQEGPGENKGFDYARSQNPTRFALEDNLAALEGGKYGLAFGSGCAATAALTLTLSAGDHVLASDDMYGGTFRLFDKVMKNLGLTFSYVDMSNAKNVGNAIQQNTRLIWVETPSNPMLKLIDIAAVCDEANKKNVPVAVDNTFATPYLQQPLALGATFAVHSTTKYIGGHSDVIGGAIVMNDRAWRDRLYLVQKSAGAVPGPMDCFLLLRSTKTLHVRMARHIENAAVIADLLNSHPEVEKVYYPGLRTHPQYELCKRQMKAPGGMISFVVRGGLDKAKKVIKSTRLFALAESLGGVESLIEHPAIMTHASLPPETRMAVGIEDGLIRISCGIEDIADLKADLTQALSTAA
jgi:cystathionine beta-lyase/cystathionine gamma-synthase